MQQTPFMDEYIVQQKEILALERRSLEALKSGQGDLHEMRFGVPARNTTSEAIARNEAAIRERELLIADYEADNAQGS